MKKALKFTTETQTEKRETISLCHLNLPVISLETSNTARTMFKLNRSLFDKINSNIKLLSGRVYRLEVTKNKRSFNKNGMLVDNAYDYTETQISQLKFENNSLKKTQRYKSKSNRFFDHDPSIDNSGQNKSKINHGYLTEDEISQMDMVSEIQQIDLFQDRGIKTFMLKDNLNTGMAFNTVAYRIEILCDSDFDEFVQLVLAELEESITFLEKYSRISLSNSSYNHKEAKFTDSFKKSVLEPLEMQEGKFVNLGSKKIKNSDFGKAAIAFYNSNRLISQAVDKSVYGEIIKSLLPFSNNNPRKISVVLKSFQDLYSTIKSHYGISQTNTKKERRSIKVNSKNRTSKFLIATTAEKFHVENEKLGYNLFSEKQKGINSFTRSAYAGRINQERAKYFPSMDIKDKANFLTSREKSNFTNTSNADSYITPASLILGDKEISTARGMANMDVQAVKNFRLAKSSRAANLKATNFPGASTRASSDENVLSAFNISISSPRTPLLSRAADQKIDPFVDAKEYLGNNSLFVTTTPKFILDSIKKISNKDGIKVLSIVTNIVNRSFLREENALNSVKEIQFTNKNSKIRKLTEKKQLAISEIPPHIKYMCTSEFQPSENIDPLKNSESRELIEETQKNVFLVKALVGFEKDSDGFFDLNLPITKNLSDVNTSTGPVLAKAYNFEIPELGVVKDKFVATIYNNLLYIKG